jgi:hypothetical protein
MVKSSAYGIALLAYSLFKEEMQEFFLGAIKGVVKDW